MTVPYKEKCVIAMGAAPTVPVGDNDGDGEEE